MTQHARRRRAPLLGYFAREPHLHVHAQRPDPVGALIGGDPLPLVFIGRFPMRGDRTGWP